MPNATIEFFRVHITDPNHTGTFEALLDGLQAREPKDRTAKNNAGWDHFHRWATTANRGVGDVLRVRADQLPAAADVEGTLEDLALDKDQGIAAVTYFYYRRSNRAFLMLRTPGSLGAPGIEYLIKQLTAVDVELRVVMPLDEIEKLRRMREMKRVSFKLSTPDPEQHVIAGKSVAGVFDVMAEFDAHVVEMTLAAGRKKAERLNRSKTIRLAEQLQRAARKTGDVTKAIVYGIDPVEEKSITLDLLHARMRVKAEVSVGPNRRLDDASCVSALEAAYISKSEELEEIFGEA